MNSDGLYNLLARKGAQRWSYVSRRRDQKSALLWMVSYNNHGKWIGSYAAAMQEILVQQAEDAKSHWGEYEYKIEDANTRRLSKKEKDAIHKEGPTGDVG
jgi:hypothetical protein